RARAVQASQGAGRGPHRLGHRLDLVRLAAGPDHGVPHLRDPGRHAGSVWLSGADADRARKNFRPQRGGRVRGRPGGRAVRHPQRSVEPAQAGRTRAAARTRACPGTAHTSRVSAAFADDGRASRVGAQNFWPGWASELYVPVGVALAFPLLLAARYADVLIPGVPHVQQKPDFCGEAAAEMWLHKLGLRMDQNAVFDCSGVDPLAGRGAWTRELKVRPEPLGFQVGPVWFQVPADRAPAALEASFRALHADLERGVPSIVCMHYDESEGAPEHFRLILGYDAHSDEVIYHEPAQAGGAYRHMKRDRFLRLWPLKYQPAEWTLVRLRLAARPRRITPPPPPPGVPSARYPPPPR